MKAMNALWAVTGFVVLLMAGGHAAKAQDTQFQMAQPGKWASQQSAALDETDKAVPAKPVEWMESEKTCLKCHEDTQSRSIMSTAHGVKGDKHSPMGGSHTCETCHGASPEHNNAQVPKGQKRPPVAVVFKGEFLSPAADRNKVCATCHVGGEHINWPGSPHNANDVACSDCHTSHTLADPVMSKKTEPGVCFTCHTEQRAESYQFSHHPMREGKVTCSDCHNTHGSPAPKLLKEFTLNEVCYQCHAEQRGPFMWEHEPVREDCSTCHQSHGSTQASLLKLRQPFVCQTCHQTTRNNHEGVVSGANQLSGGSGLGNWNLTQGRGCSNCHSKVHGSNAPSGGMLTH